MTSPVSFATTLERTGNNTGITLNTRQIDIRSYAHDASHFILYPEAVMVAESIAQIQEAFALATAAQRPLSFRSGGTSLSGQGITDGLLVDTRKKFRTIKVLDQGLRVKVGPGATVRQVNNVLRRYGRALGPDPASEIAATIGGVLANNSSGMVCGTTENSYHTVESLVLVLPSGTTINTSDPDADAQLQAAEPHLYEVLRASREKILNSPELTQIIAHQYSMKNTMGYGLNSLVDFDTPIDMLTHLLIGSEGTLGFIAEATFTTVAIQPHVATSLMVFDSLDHATRILPELVDSGARAIELMDSQSLLVAQGLVGVPELITDINVQDHAALLVEYQAANPAELEAYIAAGQQVAAAKNVAATFSTDPAVQNSLWKVRKGLFTAVAGARPAGTTALLEDVVVPVEKLADTCHQLHQLFDRYHYENAVIFGHAKDGNIHFLLTDRFDSPAAVERFSQFTEDLVTVILAAGGSLKAEHGTGRVMAPFVRRQFGDELHQIMVDIKRACDPHGILNPGVIITDNPREHLMNLKPVPEVDELIDRCVECGYCEPACPSKDLTLTPRTRIVIQREVTAAQARGDHDVAEELIKDYEYSGIDTCAVDGMCQIACPVNINTGDLVRSLRTENSNRVENLVWSVAGRNWGATTKGASVALNVAQKLPPKLVSGTTSGLRKVLGEDVVPQWSPDLPGGGHSRRRKENGGKVGALDAPTTAVFFPSCLNTMFAGAQSAEQPGASTSSGKAPVASVQTDFEAVCKAAGIQLLVPDGIDSACCGTPWSSKGMANGYQSMTERTADLLWEATGQGALPVVCDASSCTEGLIKLLKGRGITVIDAPQFVVDTVLPGLEANGIDTQQLPRVSSVTLHPTCSTAHLGTGPAVEEIANLVADEVSVPQDWGCCGFAGDRGMLHPELTASATSTQAEQVKAIGAEFHASSNRTCEMAMSRATGESYVGIIQLLARQLAQV